MNRLLSGKEIQIGPGAIVNCTATVGADVILNTGSVIEHDCRIGDHVHVAPGTVLGGEVSVGEGVPGLGSRVLPRVKIGAWAVVGAGAVVTKDVPPFAVAVGVPAKVRLPIQIPSKV